MSITALSPARPTIELPPLPEAQGGELIQALRTRRSTRAFKSAALPSELLSALLWAAFGINRPRSAGRTAPSAHGWQEIDVYAALAEGLYRYDAAVHALRLAVQIDVRAHTGMQDFVAHAPLNLVYVADFSRMLDASEQERTFFAATDAAVIAQNVYLYCASAGLGTVVRGLVDRRKLAAAMRLRPEQRIVLAQTVGFPAR
jgi:SagB-type dehydrogenase family enzyme